jgi:hypothetical protein
MTNEWTNERSGKGKWKRGGNQRYERVKENEERG